MIGLIGTLMMGLLKNPPPQAPSLTSPEIPESLTPSVSLTEGFNIDNSIAIFGATDDSLGPPKKLMLGDLEFHVVEAEQMSGALRVQKHPVENRKQVSDNAWRDPIELEINGLFVAYPVATAKHRLALLKLEELRQKAVPVALVCDFPPMFFDRIVVTRYSAKRAYPWTNAYEITLALEQVDLVSVVSEATPGQTDLTAIAGNMDTTITLDGPVFATGLQQGTALSIPSSDTSLGGTVDKFTDKYVDMTYREKATAVESALATVKENSPSEAALIHDALSGDVACQDALYAGAQTVPGGTEMLNMIFGAMRPTSPPGGSISAAGSVNAESAAASFVGAMMQSIGAQVPEMASTGMLMNRVLSSRRNPE